MASTHSIQRLEARAIPLGGSDRSGRWSRDRWLGRWPARWLAQWLAVWGVPGLVAAALLLAPQWAGAGNGVIYSYTDDRGVTHFTNIRKGDDRYRPVRAADHLRHIRRVPERRDYDLLIHATALETRVPPALVKAVIAAESAFDPQAVSRKGAQGLMQLMPQTARILGVEDAFEPTQNVRGGSTYLREMLDRYGDLSRAVAAYNAGPGAVDRYGGIPPYPETRAYVDRVLTYYRHYHGDFAR